MTTALEVAARLLVVLLVFLTVPLLVGQMEHKAMAHMQGRLGPMYAGGFHGWAQLVADGIKFAQKESVVPKAADRRVFELAPFVALLPYLLVGMVSLADGRHFLMGEGADIDIAHDIFKGSVAGHFLHIQGRRIGCQAFIEKCHLPK